MATWSFAPTGDEIRDKCTFFWESPGPRDTRRMRGGETACVGNVPGPGECVRIGIPPKFLDLWFRGIGPETTEIPRAAALDD